MKFLIPSYMRADRQRTLRELLRLGVDKDDIFIGVQTRSDFDIYKNCADGFENIVYKPAHNLSGNYNNLLEEFRDHDVVALMDDDIRAIGYVREGGKGGKATPEQFRACIESMGDVVLSGRASICTAWTSTNAVFAERARKAHGDIARGFISSGWLMVVDPRRIRFDESLSACEDYDVQLRELNHGRDVYRCNRIYPYTPSRLEKNGEQSGGRGFFYEDEENIRQFKEIERRYFPLARFDGTSIRLNRRYI
mgnify:FL=1